MKFNLATGFDRAKQDEEFTAVVLSEELIRATLQKVFQKMDYAELRAWVEEHRRSGELVVT